jgi:histidine ammonia-lyase
VDYDPDLGGKEDHVSMGVHAARKAAEIVANVETVLAIELLAAAQALDFLAPLKGGRGGRGGAPRGCGARPRARRDRGDGAGHRDGPRLIESGDLLAEVERRRRPLA